MLTKDEMKLIHEVVQILGNCTEYTIATRQGDKVRDFDELEDVAAEVVSFYVEDVFRQVIREDK